MKSQERHDLKKNELVENLEKIKKYLQEQGTRILAVVVLAAVIISVVSYVRHSNQIARQQAMEQLIAIHSGSAGSKPEDIKAIAEQASDKKLAALAWKIYGDQVYNQYATGNKAAPKDALTLAEKAYETVINNYPSETLTAAGAKICLGAVYEDQHKWADARKLYQAISEDTALAGTGLIESAKSKLVEIDVLEKSVQQPLATTQPAVISTKPSTSSTTKLAK
jgi:predicted negative regulator of RcsB-dependent stress response